MTTTQHLRQLDAIGEKLGRLKESVNEIDELTSLRAPHGYNENLHGLEREVFQTILNNMWHEINLLNNVLVARYHEIKDSE